MSMLSKTLVMMGIPLVMCVLAFEAGNKIGYNTGRLNMCNMLMSMSSDDRIYCRMDGKSIYMVIPDSKQEVEIVDFK